MKKLFVLMILTLFVFSSCSDFGSSSKKTNAPSIDTKGDGLELDFNVDSRAKGDGTVTYNLKVKNTGSDPITLSQENFQLRTLQASSDDINQPVFTTDSIESFYNRVFGSGTLLLYNNGNEINFNGKLAIEEDYFRNPNNDKIDVVLKVEYPYETKFSNSIEIDLTKLDGEINYLGGKPSQAAPVKITKIILEPGFQIEDYEIKYTIENRGDKFSIATINDIDFKFGAQNRLSNCRFIEEDRDTKREIEYSPIRLNDELRKVVYICSVDLEDVSNLDPITFVTSGTINYDYQMVIKDEISLPDIEDIDTDRR